MQRARIATLWIGAMLASPLADAGADSLVYIGTRSPPQAAQTPASPDAAPPPSGIYAARLDGKTGKLTALGQQQPLRGASWLLSDSTRPLLYSVGRPPDSATAETLLHTFAVDEGSGALRQTGETASGGHDTTYLYADRKTATLFGASYGGGEVTASPILADGTIGPVSSVQKNVGSGPHPRQSGPHAHAVALDPTRHFVLSSDLGADRVFVYRFDATTRALAPADPAFEALTPGSGPRHLLFHPNGKFVYVNTELTAELWIYRWDARNGRLLRLQSASLYREGYDGASRSSSELAFSRDGRFLYVTLRGDQNSIVVYAVNSRTGAVREVQRVPSQGKQPWAFGIDPSGRWLVVANNGSNSVDVLAIDRSSGTLRATGESLPVPGAAAIAFVARRPISRKSAHRQVAADVTQVLLVLARPVQCIALID
jgi:6-phosphogluconolactonase